MERSKVSGNTRNLVAFRISTTSNRISHEARGGNGGEGPYCDDHTYIECGELDDPTLRKRAKSVLVRMRMRLAEETSVTLSCGHY